MSDRDDQLANHAVWSAIEAFMQKVEEGSEKLELQDAERFRSVVTYVKRAFDSADPYLVPISALGQIQGHVTAASQQVDAYVTSGNVANLNTAHSKMDSILEQASSLRATSAPTDVADIRDDISSFRKSASQLVNGLKSEIEKAESQLSTLQSNQEVLGSEISDQNQRVDAVISDFQSQFSQAQESRSNDNDAARSARQEEHAEALHSARTELDEAMEQRKAQAEEQAEATSSIHDDFKAAGKLTLDEIEGFKAEAARVVGVVGNIGLTGDYQKNAKTEKRQAFWWSIAALLFFMSAVGLAVYFLAIGADGLDAEATARRIALSLVALTPGSFCAAKARDHRRIERRDRSLELELASLSPFIASLPEDEQDLMKTTLAPRYFRGPVNGLPPGDTSAMEKLTQRLSVSKTQDKAAKVVE